jgi:zinc transport system ATP-binding protein
MGESVLEVTDLTVKYGDVVALEGVSFSVAKGDVVGIVGPNGGGKSTLLKAILGSVPITSGRISLFGQDSSKFHSFERIGYVSQNAIQFDPIFPATVREIVSLGCMGRKRLGRRLSRAEKESVSKALEIVDLHKLADRQISHLSGGQKQRIFLAKALVRKPELLILDEATAGLDICIQDRFIQLVNKLRKEAEVTVMTVSHDLSGVLCQANRLAVVNRKIYYQDIGPGTDPNKALRDAYGEHFTFMYHHDHNSCSLKGGDLIRLE